MNATNLLAELQQRGVTLTLDGGRLRWRGPKGAMTPALKAALVANKRAVRRLLEAERHPAGGGQVGAQVPGAADAPQGREIAEKGGTPAQTSPSEAQGEPGDLEARLEALLVEMAAATGCPDAQAEELLARWEGLMAEFEAAGDNGGAAGQGAALARWPDDPPPLGPCGWSAAHRRYWRRPEGGWVCAACHPPPPGVEMATWEVPEAVTGNA